MMMGSFADVRENEDRLAAAIKFVELVAAPCGVLGLVVFQVADCTVAVVALLNVALVALVDVVVERIFEGQCEELVGALDFEGDCSDDSFVGAPREWHTAGSVEESGSDDIGLEILLDSSFLHVPANDLNDGISVISDLNLVESVVAPVVALGDILAVEVVIGVVVVTKVVGRIHVRSHW